MNNLTLSTAHIRDITPLKKLWQAVFGDSDECIDLFFDEYFQESHAMVVRLGEEIASMAFILPSGDYNGKKCAMIYAVATDEKQRGHGCGSMVTDGARAQAQSLGYEVITLVPAQESLFHFYERLGFRASFFAHKVCLTHADSCAELIPVSWEEYGRIREKILISTPHIVVPDHALRVQERLGELFGGKMMKITVDEQCLGCLYYEQEDSTAEIKEYFCSLPPEKVCGPIGAEKYNIVLPSTNGEPYAMAYGEAMIGLYGLAFG